jgi:hypothetical protein
MPIRQICILFYFLGGWVCSNLYAQSIRFWNIDAQIRNYGFDAGGSYSKHYVNDPIINHYGIRIGSINDPKEIFVINNGLPGAQSFKVDKVNYAWTIRPYITKSYWLNRRTSRNEVGYGLFGSLQLPLAYCWPVHIWISQGNVPFDGFEDVQYNPEVHRANEVGGTSSFMKGIKNGRVIPGLALSTGFILEWGSYRSLSNALSIGFANDLFVQKIPLLHQQRHNSFVFPYVFVNFAIGFGQ